jgi:hypothetical protein
LHGRQQQGDQHADDGDDDQELDERKGSATSNGERARGGDGNGVSG